MEMSAIAKESHWFDLDKFEAHLDCNLIPPSGPINFSKNTLQKRLYLFSSKYDFQ